MSELVKQMKAYINAHLKEPVTAGDIARAVGYSPYYASRAFKAEVGLSPFEYLRQQRLTGAAHALRRRGSRVLDVALDFVFDSHEGFTRAFVNGFGITPKRYAARPSPEGWRILYRYLDRRKNRMEEQKMEEDTKVMFMQVIKRPARKLILRRSKKAGDYFAYCEEFGCGPDAPWEILCGIREALYEPVGLWLPENMRPEGTGIYAHGVEVPADYQGELPAGFEVIDLPEGLMLCSQGEPYDDEQYQKAVGAACAQLDKFNPEVYGYTYAWEEAPRMQLAPMGWRGYIELRPVRALAEEKVSG